MTGSQSYRESLTQLPVAATLHSVDAVPTTIAGRAALRVQLTADVVADGIPGIDFIDAPTFVMLPVEFSEGVIEFDLLSRLTPDAPDYARAFAGIAYRIVTDVESFECVYVRPMNGRGLNPPPPRDVRAAQYFAFPEWKFDRIREEFAGGTYEAGADIAPDTWMHVRLEVAEHSVRLFVDGVGVLDIEHTLVPATPGAIGLWVDIGTEAYFADLVVHGG